jgi:hypothetical protein
MFQHTFRAMFKLQWRIFGSDIEVNHNRKNAMKASQFIFFTYRECLA